MDPLAALLSERPPQQLSATELRSRIALLEDAARAYRAELDSRTAWLDALPDEIQQIIFGQLCNALDPRAAVAYSSTSKGLRELMQRVGEGASKSLLQQLKEENAAAAALCLKVGVRSCKALREAKKLKCINERLSATDLATLGKLTPVLPALELLRLDEWSASAGRDGGQLLEGLGVGALPAVTIFVLDNVGVGDTGASVLAAALDRGALPRLKHLALRNAAIGDTGLVALAPALRRRLALELLSLGGNPFGDEGLAALVAPPADAPPPQAEALARLWELHLISTQITDDGCAHLASWLRSGALPALELLELHGIPASDVARAAVCEARPDLHTDLHGWDLADEEEDDDEVEEEDDDDEVPEEDADTYQTIADEDLAATALSAATIAAMFAEDEFDVVHMDSSDDEDASPVPRATDDEFDPPVRMDSSDEDAAPPVPGATRMDSSDD